MPQKCQKCGAEISEFDFNFMDYLKDPLQLQCPQCKTQLEDWLAELLHDDFDDVMVGCPECGWYGRTDEILCDIGQTEFYCPDCGERLPNEAVKKIVDMQPYSDDSEWQEAMEKLLNPNGSDEDEEE